MPSTSVPVFPPMTSTWKGIFSRTATSRRREDMPLSMTGATPTIGPPPISPHLARGQSGACPKETSTAMAWVGERMFAAVAAPCPPTSSRVVSATVSPQESSCSASFCAAKMTAAQPARSSAARALTRPFISSRASQQKVTRSPGAIFSRAFPAERPTSIEMSSILGRRVSSELRWGGTVQTTPGRSPFAVWTVTCAASSSAQSMPPTFETRRNPSSSM